MHDHVINFDDILDQFAASDRNRAIVLPNISSCVDCGQNNYNYNKNKKHHCLKNF